MLNSRNDITNWLLLSGILGLLIPLVTELVAKSTAPARVKALVNLILAGIAGIITPYLTLDHVPWQVIGLSIAELIASSVTSYLGIMKPVGLAGGTDSLIGRAVPGGIGPAEPEVPPQLPPAAPVA